MPDPHSFAADAPPRIEHADLKLELRFEERRLAGTAKLRLTGGGEVLDLDTSGLAIHAIHGADGRPLRFDLDAPHPTYGSRLRVFAPTQTVAIEYETGPRAPALQWLEGVQGRAPLVFSQCQPIHARSLFPCQDTPSVRFTFDAELDVPEHLQVQMGAQSLDSVVQNGRRRARFRMPQPIPSYLFAFVVGDLSRRELGPRTAVVSLPETLDEAASEFADLESMVELAEGMFGPYRWDRFDLCIMPPSFPYGGMENPRLTFVSPTLLAKDRSLVNVVVHELAHAWTGNLVTCANMEHFWLNEGFTVYGERRIVEALDGPEEAALHAALGRAALEEDLRRLQRRDPALTALRTRLDGLDPDEVFSTVPYEKGYLFLVRLERQVGRKAFDDFLRDYLDRYAFASIDTETFIIELERRLGTMEGIDLQRWLYGPGLPPDAPRTPSAKLDRLTALARAGASAEALDALSATEWQVYLHLLPSRLDGAHCRRLDAEFDLSHASNLEIRMAWLTRAAHSDYRPADPAIRDNLLQCGRMKFLRPLYEGLIARGPEGRAMAEDIFRDAQDAYHPVALSMVENLLGEGLER